MNRLLGGDAPVVFGDGEQQRDFVHVEDIVAGTLAAPDRTPGIYNLELAGHIAQRAGVDADKRLNPNLAPVHAPAQMGELRYSVADISAARTALGYAPRRSLQHDLDSVIEDVRSRLPQLRGTGPRSHSPLRIGPICGRNFAGSKFR